MKTLMRSLCAAAMLAAGATSALAEDQLKPFVLVATPAGDVAATAAEVERKLGAAGFEVVGRASPYAGATLLVITSDALKKAAASSSFGGYGAAQRVAMTKVGEEIQVSHTNPRYMAAAYRMNDDLAAVAGQLEKALGPGKPFGSKKGMTASELREYHYMLGMEYFTDPHLLAEHSSHEAALAAVEAGLAAGRSGITKVYRIDLPGKDETVFGVAMNGAKGGGEQQDDAYIMRQIDFQSPRSTAHLPYEVLVSGNKVYALSARFRIAIDFPDLSMMGANSFMSIMGSPDAIRTALTKVAGGSLAKEGQFRD